MNKNEHQARFYTIQSMILEGGYETFPGWKTFSYSDDFGAQRGDRDGTAQFVYDTLSILKEQRMLKAHDKADNDFSVQLTFQCYQALSQKIEPVNAETQLIDYIKKAAPDALKAVGIELLTSAVIS